MDNKKRRRIYQRQNGNNLFLTDRQKRRLATKRALNKGKAPRRPK